LRRIKDNPGILADSRKQKYAVERTLDLKQF
jgi:hypothetical protein